MSREVQVVIWDDIDATEGTKTLADKHSVPLSYDGESVELDLSSENYDELYQILRPYLAAGSPVVPQRGRAAQASARMRKYSHKPGIKAYNQAMRAWADARMAEHPEYEWRTPGGGLYHPRALKEAYAAYLGSTGSR